MDVCEKHEIKTKHGHMADPVVGGVLWGVLWVVGGGGEGLGGGFWHTNNAQPGATAPTAATHSPSRRCRCICICICGMVWSIWQEGVQWRLGF